MDSDSFGRSRDVSLLANQQFSQTAQGRILKILITGICGFVGSVIAKALRHSHPDWELVGIDNFSRAGSWLNRALIQDDLEIQFVHGDLRSVSDVDTLPRCDWVIDAAANPSVLAGVDGKTSARQLVEHNLCGTLNVLEYCKRHQAGLVLLSTSRVYSVKPLAELKVGVIHDPSHLPLECLPLSALDRYHPKAFPMGVTGHGISETFSTTPPVSLYGSTKLASEQLALEYAASFEFPVWVNRCGVMAGAGQFAQAGQGIFSFWIHSFREGRPLRYLGFDGLGHQVRDCFHPRDLLPLLEKQMGEMGNVDTERMVHVAGGLGQSASLAELTSWCQCRFPDSATVLSGAEEPHHGRAFDLPWVILDNTSARRRWGWEPSISLSTLCEGIASFAEEHPCWLSVSR